jgi:transposase
MKRHEVTDDQWEVIQPILLKRTAKTGRPRLSFGAPKPATHRRPKPATVWGALDGRILLFEPVGKGCDQVVPV